MGSPGNHHTAIIDRQLFEKANEMHPKRREVLRNHAPILLWKDVKTAGIAAMCQLWAFFTKRNGASAKMLRCSNQWRSCVSKSGDPTGTAGGEYPWACSSVCSVNVGKERKYLTTGNATTKRSIPQNCKAEPTVDLGKMKLYDDYKDGRMDRDLYKQRAER